MSELARIQPLLAHASERLSDNLSLEALAGKSGWSAFHLHRAFRSVTGETPRRFVERLRISDAAVKLLTTEAPILEIAMDAGFESHEVFSRAFRRLFGMSPRTYRERGFNKPSSEADIKQHAAWIKQVAPCVALYGYQQARRARMAYTIEKKTLETQPVLTARKRVARADIAQTIGITLGAIFGHAQKSGMTLGGPPLTRYFEMSAGMVTMAPAMPIAAGAGDPISGAAEGEVHVDSLPAGPTAVTLHVGPYDQLHEAYAALEQWIAAQGLKPAGAPWESYLTDPAEVPDPKDWKTQVFWPVAEA